MRHLLSRLLLAPAAFVVVCACLLDGLLRTMGPSVNNPSAIRKSALLFQDVVATASRNSTPVEVPRGAENIQFVLEGVLFDRTTANETYDYKIQHAPTSDGSFVDVPGCTFTQIAAVSGGQQLPTSANAPGLVLQRFVRVVATYAGTTPIATANVRMVYINNLGPGRQHDFNEVGG